MPTYDFKCNSCDNRFTVRVSMQDRHKVKCPSCGQGKPTQLFTSVNILGAGSGNCVTLPNSRFT